MGHHEEPQISAHLLASIPHGTFLETFHPDRDPMFYALVANRSAFDNGNYALPQGPGFGLELDQGPSPNTGSDRAGAGALQASRPGLRPAGLAPRRSPSARTKSEHPIDKRTLFC